MKHKDCSQFNNIIQILIIAGVIAGSIWFIFKDITGHQRFNNFLNGYPTEELVKIQDNTLMAITPPYYILETEVYGTLVETHYENDVVISGLIEKLIQCESGGNPKAYNEFDPDTPSIGILQFKEKTFQAFCVDGYNLKDSIWDTTTQIQCATKMIEQGKSSHWQNCWELINQ